MLALAALAACLLWPAVVSAQTLTILVNGQSSPGNQFFQPFDSTATVTFTTSILDPVIFFTTNGNDVDFDAPVYSAPFTTTNSIQVQAFATDQNNDESTPAVIAFIQFVPSCTLTDMIPGGGAVTLNPPGGVYGSNSLVTLTANPAPGWTFSNWSGGVSGTNPVLNLTLTNNLAFTAVFVTPVALSALPANYGSVAANPPGGVYPYGTSVNVSAVPATGKMHSKLAADGIFLRMQSR
jgi:hypothetical protein